MNVTPDGTPYVQARSRQPLGLVELIDRSPGAIERHPETVFVQDATGVLLFRNDLQGPKVQGGARSLYTRVWMGLMPPQQREPGYVAVVGEEYEAHLPRFDRLSAHLRPMWILDEAHDVLVPRLLKKAADLKDLYLPYLDRADLASNPRRTDADFRLVCWPENELWEDIQRPTYGLCVPPSEDDLSDTACKARWSYWQARDHVVPPVLPPYKQDPERLHAILDALMASRTPDGREMFNAHRCCTVWAEEQWQTPHLAVAMAVAALQRWDWSERINPDLAEDDYPTPTEEEEEEERRASEAYTEAEEVALYMASSAADMAIIETQGLEAYRRIIRGEQPAPNVWVP